MLKTLFLLVLASPIAAQEPLRFSDGRWELSGTAAVETVDGRETLRLETGGAVRRDVRLEDGTIDVDVMVTRRRSFVYVAFRMQDDENHEEFYLRPHKSLAPDAVQYAPVFHGQSAWQLYHGANGTAGPEIPAGAWTHLRIVLSGRRAAVFLGDTTRPVMVVRLAREPRAGYLLLKAFLPQGTPGSGPIARYADLRVRPGVIPYAFPAEPAPDSLAGVITTWSVGTAFATRETSHTVIPAGAAGTTRVTVEPNGMVALNRWLAMPGGFAAAAPPRPDLGVVARVRIVAQVAGLRRLDLGFSDAATVFLNGRPLFHGDDSYDYPNRRDGLIGFGQAAVYLPLRAGVNELAVVVTDHFGGMGLMGRLDMRGLRVEPY